MLSIKHINLNSNLTFFYLVEQLIFFSQQRSLQSFIVKFHLFIIYVPQFRKFLIKITFY